MTIQMGNSCRLFHSNHHMLLGAPYSNLGNIIIIVFPEFSQVIKISTRDMYIFVSGVNSLFNLVIIA